MAIATTVPLVWGIATGHEQQAEWIALTADCISWVALKGDFGQRLRVLVGGSVLALFFGALGSVSAAYLWPSIGLMLLVAFIAGLFKNLGERGGGLAICVYVMFLIANAHPAGGKALEGRLFWILVGGAWNAVLGIGAFVMMPAQQSYRRSISLIWKATAGVVSAVSKGWDGKEVRSSARSVYEKEKEVRQAIDSSFVFYEQMAYQVSRNGKNEQEYSLAQVRKASALVAAHISAIHDEVDALTIKTLDAALRSRLYAVLKALESCAARASVYVLTLRSEEELLLRNRIARLRSATDGLKEYKGVPPPETAKAISRTEQLATRSCRLIDRTVSLLGTLDEQPEYRSYSLIKTVLVLHPKHWWRNIRLLFNTDSHTFRYALRTALAAAMALAIYKWFGINHGYWLPFTVMIVLQPYFGATLRKALDRVMGTLAGGLAGGLLLKLPPGLHAQEVMMFGSAVGMIYFYRRRYTVSSFFITLNLVLLFAVSEELNRNIIISRALTTMGGAAIAVVAGFLLLPAWDKKYLPRHIRGALRCNQDYFFKAILSREVNTPWTKYKRAAETANSNAFDSFNRFMQEYHRDSKGTYRSYYNLIAHNVRITRELNNLLLELDGIDKDAIPLLPSSRVLSLLEECAEWFGKIMARMHEEAVAPLPAPVAIPHNEVYLERLLAELKAMYNSIIALPAND